MEITAEILLNAYADGVFPMAESADDPDIFWVEPDQRGIIPLGEFHIPRSLKKKIKQQPFQIEVDSAFHEVMQRCAEETETRKNTWINGTILDLYGELFEMGYCHSVECWDNNQLVGGLYGVHIGGAFFGESMFSRATDASKIALAHLVERLKYGGFSLLDTQFTTEHLERFGAKEIPKKEYATLLKSAIEQDGDFYALNNEYETATSSQPNG